jgi:hypothetical protein
MSEPLENFIKNNKEKFDVYDAPEGLWDKLDGQLNLHQKKEHKSGTLNLFITVFKIAALFIMVLSFGFLWGNYQKQQSLKLENINPVYAKKEIQFSSLIESKQEVLKSLSKVDPSLYQNFVLEQQKLENEYKFLNKQLASSPNKDRIVKAMIRNLQLQIDLLNQQINISNEVKQFKKQENEQAI